MPGLRILRSSSSRRFPQPLPPALRSIPYIAVHFGSDVNTNNITRFICLKLLGIPWTTSSLIEEQMLREAMIAFKGRLCRHFRYSSAILSNSKVVIPGLTALAPLPVLPLPADHIGIAALFQTRIIITNYFPIFLVSRSVTASTGRLPSMFKKSLLLIILN